jgi:hypothetical protein
MSEERPCEICRTPTSTDLLVTIGGQTVCATCKPEVVMNLKSGVSSGSRITPERAEAIRMKISRLNLLSFALAIPGIALQVLSKVLISGHAHAPLPLILLRVASVPLVIAGLCCYARMKGRNWALGLFGLLSCLGLIILSVLPKCCHNCRHSDSYRVKECRACGAPM